MTRFFDRPTLGRASMKRATAACSNVALWAAFVSVVLAADGYFLSALHHRIDWDSVLALAALTARTALFVSGGLFIEALLLRVGQGYLTGSGARRSVLHAYWIGVMLLSVTLVADILVYAFAGYHIPTGLRILLSDGPLGVVKVADATGLSPTVIVVSALGLALGIAIAIVLSKLSRRLSQRAGIVVSRRRALAGALISLGVLALVEMASYRLRDPFLWEREIREVPLAFGVVRPQAELASFRISVRRPTPHTAARREGSTPTQRPDVFIVIIESLRADMLVPEVMPWLAEFAKHAWTFEHAVTTGNVTHYSWYGLLCGRIPLYFDVVKKSPAQHGSAALGALRDAGYQVHLWATPDTEYQNIEAIVFASRRPNAPATLLTGKFRPTAPNVARRDELVVQELTRRLATTPPGGALHVVALDSPHFGYQWGPDFHPPFVPYAKDISIAKDYENSATQRRAVVNRYKNSVAWIDSLLGRLFQALERSHRTNGSIVVVTGDHGEAFWEHGSATHGSDLGEEQLEVAFAMKLPGHGPRRRHGVFSLLDVMPTLLHELGLRAAGLDGTAEQLRLAKMDATLQNPVGNGRFDRPPGAAFTFQGWNERAYRFALTTERRRLLFELDSVDPLNAQRLVLREAVDLSNGSRVGGEHSGTSRSYQDVLVELPAILGTMDFLRLESP